MCMNCIYKEKVLFQSRLNDLIEGWGVVKEEGADLGGPMVKALQSVHQTVGELSAVDANREGCLQSSCELTVAIGGAHTLIRVFMGSFSPSNVPNEIRRLMMDTRMMMDGLFLCLRIKDTTTLEEAVSDLISEFTEHLKHPNKGADVTPMN